jgi:FMN-dependent NADH-azoreductase
MVVERLLHIDASPRDTRSRSRHIADHYLACLAEAAPSITVTRFDLWRERLPDLGGAMIEGRYALIAGQPVAREIETQWVAVERMVDRFLSFDSYLISTPMWNFGIPYRLKHFVDIVTQPRMAFTNGTDGNVIGHAAGKPATIIAASALDIREGGPLADLDFQIAYLTAWLQFIGVTEIAALRAAPTFGPADQVEQAVQTATVKAGQMARAFADQLSNAARP